MISESNLRDEVIIDVAKKMSVAAETAPKGHGRDNTVSKILLGDEIRRLSDHLKEMHKAGRTPDFFARDAENILQAPAVFLIGTKVRSMGLSPCGNCGFANCEESYNFV